MNPKGKYYKNIARTLLWVLTIELVSPAVHTYALTGGPSQPEVQSFEPAGTTDMVDLFSGDFVYNIPLLDVDGYPINISYHSGIGVEDEASWVGLGWNINPGAINRSVRGVPDDFKGDQLYKMLKIKTEKETRLKFGLDVEIAGSEKLEQFKLMMNFGHYVSYNNYKGIGLGFSTGIGFQSPVISTGLGYTVSSNEGADIDSYLGLVFASSEMAKGEGNGVGLRLGTGYNTRSGLKALSYGVSLIQKEAAKPKPGRVPTANQMKGASRGYTSGINMGSYIPIGMQNYVSALTNETRFTSFEFTAKFGFEAALLYGNLNAALYTSALTYQPEGSKPSYGYMYLQDAGEDGVVDLSREKDGTYNATLPNLPLSSFTYDVFSISGQGTGGVFRPFRSDIGTGYDPVVKSATTSANAGVEVGVGSGFEIGGNLAYYSNKVESGPIKRALFQKNAPNSLFENTYFKLAGELTSSLAQGNSNIASHSPVRVDHMLNMHNKEGQMLGGLPAAYTPAGDDYARTARATNIIARTNEELANKQSTIYTPDIKSYPQNVFYDNNASISTISRSGAKKDQAQPHHIGEITQLLSDGRTYVYGIPVMNNVQKEITMKIAAQEPNSDAYKTGLVATPASYNDDYTQVTVTPAYAHSYLLTAVLSADYIDVTGDGPTDDDLGSYVKFNYTRTSPAYVWRSPYDQTKAQFNPGFYSDIQDDKASYVSGSKELWYLHSVETKNNIAEFTLSARLDGKGAGGAALTAADIYNNSTYSNDFSTASTSPASTANNTLYRLDHIKLYSKADRYVNKQNAVPIRSVFFDYDYSLCGGTPNSSATGGKKLTLKRIYFKNGNSEKSLLNPYVFEYNEQNNYDYAYAAKDRWGNYKPNNPDHSNFENPYVAQDPATANQYAAAWLLHQIKLPSGGQLTVNYESDDYSYVQDKDATEMLNIEGVGISPSFEPKDVLYEDDQVYNYVYFKVDPDRLIQGKTLAENYFRNNPESLLYFSFMVDLPARNRYEPVKGYAKVEQVDYCPGTNNEYGYFKLKYEKMGRLSQKNIHPITLAGLNMGRYYLPHIIYPGSTTQYSNEGNAEVLRGLKDAFRDLMSGGRDVNHGFVKRGLARSVDIHKSWIRTSTPGYTKLGGGSRVQSLQLSDEWNTMASNGTSTAVGKYYDYTIMSAEAGKRISSGVASNEPMIGGEENALRKPINYTGDKGRLLPPVELFQEAPLGESFYPGASIGYRQVSVTSIHQAEGRSSQSLDVSEFYTAKEFPVYIDYTRINKDISRRRNKLLYKMEDLGVSQGYVLYLNDMHGKVKSMSNYVLKEDKQELITSVKYNYQTDSKGRLNNTVKAVVRQAFGNSSGVDYEVKDIALGEEVDYTVDNRQRYMSSLAASVNINLNVALFGAFPLVIPAVFSPPKTEESWFRTATATKIIQQYGICSSVEQYDHGAKTIVHNTLYDGVSGAVLLTQTSNDYKDPVANLNFPAHWYHEQMGPAYMNIGYEEIVENFTVDSLYNGKLSGVDDVNRYGIGDELLLTVKNSSGTQVYQDRVWVTMGSVGTGIGTLNIVPRAKYLNGNYGAPWFAQNAAYSNVHVKVLRSGRRNRLNESMQQYSFKGSYSPTGFTSLFNYTPAEVIAASSVTYNDNAWNMYNLRTLFGDGYGYNDFVKGIKGHPLPDKFFSHLNDRKYDNNHSRTDGTFQTQALFTYLPQSSGFGGAGFFLNYDAGIPGKWHILKRMTYDNSGNQVQEIDASGRTAAVLYGYQNQLPVAVADNAGLKDIMYHGFDDLYMLYHQNSAALGQTATYRTTEPLSFAYHSNGQSYGVYNYNNPSQVVYGNTYNVVNEAHTGKYGLKATSTVYRLPLYTTQLYGAQATTDLFLSMWVKPPTGTSVNAAAFTVNGTTPFTAMTGSIDGWYKLDCHMPGVNNSTAIFIHIPASYIVDDVRVCPEQANMKTFTYDPITQRLLAQMDENNYATFFEYDAEGQLIRTKKETNKGILTVNESRLSNKK